LLLNIICNRPMLPAYFCHVPFMKISTSCLLNSMLFIKYFERAPCISTNFEWPTFSNMNILYMRTQTLCHRIEKPCEGWLWFLVGQKRSSSSLVILKSHPRLCCPHIFATWLKVASIIISRSTVSDCVPFLVVPFLFDIERN
jgi:hypothetical protein